MTKQPGTDAWTVWCVGGVWVVWCVWAMLCVRGVWAMWCVGWTDRIHTLLERTQTPPIHDGTVFITNATIHAYQLICVVVMVNSPTCTCTLCGSALRCMSYSRDLYWILILQALQIRDLVLASRVLA